MPSAGRVLGLACALVGLAIDGLGCLSDDTAVTVRAPDAGALSRGGTGGDVRWAVRMLSGVVPLKGGAPVSIW